MRRSPIEIPVHVDINTRIPLRPMLLAAVGGALLTAPVIWSYRYLVSGDGLSYIDVADSAARSGVWPLLSNAYWSPSYPALLAVAMKALSPSPASELAVVRSLDCLICVFTYSCYTYFLLNLLRWIQRNHGGVFASSRKLYAVLALAYTLQFVSNLDSTLWLVGPHVLVEGMVYLIGGACLRLSLPGSRLIHHAGLGVILGLAYVTKAAMFPLSFGLLAILFVMPASREVGRKGTALAAAAFLVTAAPLVATLSYAKGRVTFGDVGHLAYARFVNDLPYFWEGPLPASVTLRHPPETVSASPVVLKFAGPFQATWPLWYDPSYWYEGIPAHFNLRQQMVALLRSFGIIHRSPGADDLLDAAERSLPMFAGIAALAFLGLRVGTVYKMVRGHIWLLAWPAFALFTFASVLVHYRYILPFLVLGWTALFAVGVAAMQNARAQAVAAIVAGALLLIAAPGYGKQLAHSVIDTDVFARRNRFAAMSPAQTAIRLRAAGIQPGDELASVEFPYRSGYAVRLTGARFNQMIVGAPAMLSKLPADEVRRLLGTLQANGAKALIAFTGPAFENDSGWIRVRDDVFVRLLH